MITVGINENVVLINAVQDANEGDKVGKLGITFDSAENLAKEKVSVFDSLQSAKVEGDSKGTTLNIFPFKKPSGPRNESKTQDELIEMVSDDMKKVKNQLTQILQQFLPEDEIKWDPFKGTGVTNDNYRQKWLDNDALGSIFSNYAQQFIQMVTPFLANPAYKMRLKLVRQSADKHFATLPGRFLDEQPFIEPMDVPAKDSRVKFTAWEIANKYNDGTPIAKASATADVAPGATPAEATTSVFGER